MAYSTGEVAQIIGIHPNTVRFYEEMELLPKVGREYNGYRTFTDLHLTHIRLIRIAFNAEIVQGNLRKMIVELLKTAAKGDYAEAERQAELYLLRLIKLKGRAYDALNYAAESLESHNEGEVFSRLEIMDMLDTNAEALRHWERSGLVQYPRKDNGRVFYTTKELKRLTIISTLRDGDRSVEEIGTMLEGIDNYKGSSTRVEAEKTQNGTLNLHTEIDKIEKSLDEAIKNYPKIREYLNELKKITLQ